MKRTLLNRRNALLGGAFWRAGAALLVLAFFIFLLRFFFPSALLAAAAPAFRLSDDLSTTAGNFFDGFHNAQTMTRERDALAVENQILSQENAALSAKVADLEKLVGTEPAQPASIIAGVLARPPEAPYDTLIVAAGASGGVSTGDTAYTAGGIPIGLVTGTSADVARVTLLSAPSEVTDAWVGASRIPVTLRGEGAGAFIAQLSRGASASTSDAVYVSGPGALPIGTVASVEGDASSPVVTLSIAGSVNVFSITEVLIGPPGPATWPSGTPLATTTLP